MTRTRTKSNVCTNLTHAIANIGYSSLNFFTKWYYKNTKPYANLPHCQGITSLEILFGPEGKQSTTFADHIEKTTNIALKDKSKKCSTYFGTNRAIVLIDPIDIADLYENHESDLTSEESIPLFRRYFGDDVIMAQSTDSKKWKPLRNDFVSRILDPKAMKNNTQTIQKIAKEHIQKYAEEKTINLEDIAATFTIDVILRTLLKVNNVTDSTKLQLAKLISTGVDEVVKMNNIAKMMLPLKINLPGDDIVNQGKNFIKNEIILPNKDSIKQSDNWISMKLKQATENKVDEKIDSNAMLQEIMFLLTAGHETTAKHLYFTFYQVAKHPDVLKAIIDEVTSLNKKPEEWDEDDFKKMTYLDCVSIESLRTLPPLPIQKTRAKRDFKLKDDTLIKKDDQIYINIGATHRLASVYDNPTEFKPERFKEYKIDSFLATTYAKNFPFRYAWMPFGTGARMCVGRALAVKEVKVVLANFAYYFGITLQQDFTLKTKTTFGQSPNTDEPLTLTLTRRKQ